MRAAVKLFAAVMAAGLALPAMAQNVTRSGAGFYVNSDAWIVTSAQLVDGCSQVKVLGETASPVLADRQTGVAAIRMPPNMSIRPMRIRQDFARPGESIVTFTVPNSGRVQSAAGSIGASPGIGDGAYQFDVASEALRGAHGGAVVDRSGYLLGFAAQSETDNGSRAVRAYDLARFLNSRNIVFDLASKPNEQDIQTVAQSVSPSIAMVECVSASSAAPPVETPPPQNPPPQNPPPQANVPPPPQAPTSSFARYQGFDIMGFDYDSRRDVSISECEAACTSDSKCQAATYNNQVRFCFLKSDGQIAVKNAVATAIVSSALQKRIQMSSFTITSGQDMAGGDYNSFQSTFLDCYIACESDLKCKAFSYIRAKKQCWMKDSQAMLTPRKGIDLGYRGN